MPSDKPERRLTDILENIDRINEYIGNYNRQQFERDRMCQDAIERCLSRIAEAATKIKDVAESLAPDQPWSDIRGLGNLLRHEYDRVDRGMIWNIVTNDLGSLRLAVQNALLALESRGSGKA